MARVVEFRADMVTATVGSIAQILAFGGTGNIGGSPIRRWG
jgi:hypothetical protein